MIRRRRQMYKRLYLILLIMLLVWDLALAQVPREQVTESLKIIWELSEHDAANEADVLRKEAKRYSDEDKRVAGFFIGVALERANQPMNARIAYEEVMANTQRCPYATSAAFRLHFLNDPKHESNAMEKVFEKIANEPVAEGWFLLANQWILTTTRRAAWQTLVDLRADRLSFRFFQFLRSQSPFPPPYAYLFILLMLTMGVKVLTMPLQVKAAKLGVQMRRLLPDVQNIQTQYKDDPQTGQQELLNLYKRHGINPFSGCLFGLMDMVFVIWALVILSNFSPQLTLDSARFLWVSDVTKFSFSIIVVWCLVQTLTVQQLGQSRAQLTCGVLFVDGIVMAIAWYWHWPAYIFIFWGLLIVVGTIITRILTLILMARE